MVFLLTTCPSTQCRTLCIIRLPYQDTVTAPGDSREVVDMPRRVPPSERRNHQLLLRFTDEEFEVLEAAAHLNRATPNTYAYELLTVHLARLATDEFVQTDLRNRRQFEQRQAATLPLPSPRGSSAVEANPDSQANNQT